MATISLSLGAILTPSRPVANRIIHISVEGLLATDGSSLTGSIEFYYTTRFTPLYSSAMRVRLLAGEFLSEVPDDTINQIIHYFSEQAGLMNYVPENSALNPTTYANYRARWATAATIITLLSGTSINASMAKRLGDFSVRRDKAAEELFRMVTKELMELTQILEDGGNYGRDMLTVTRGSDSPDFPTFGRGLSPQDTYDVPSVPGANSRGQFSRTSDGVMQRRVRRVWSR